jgi:hypothetical protein
MVNEIVESIHKLDAKKGDVLLVKVKIEIDGIEQLRIAQELRSHFPGVHVFVAGPNADLEVIRDKLRRGWRGKEENDGEGA